MRNKKIMLVAVMAVAIFVFVFAFAGCKDLDTSNEKTTDSIYNINGYQVAPTDVKAITKEGERIVPISEMLEACGYGEIKGTIKGEEAVEIAANIYHMIVRNASKTIGTGYQVATNASVSAGDVYAAVIGSSQIHLDSFSVGLRSTYSSMDDDKNGQFVQTISGVTKLKLSGALEPIGNAIKGLFGYNIQNYSNDEFIAHRNGGNGGAKFINFSKDKKDIEEGNKLILGAKRDNNPMKSFPRSINNSKGWDSPGSWTIKSVNEEASAEMTAESSEKKIWEPLDPVTYDNKIDVNIPGKDPLTYTLGNMGCGWALYNFDAEMLDSKKTEVSYKDGVYTIKLKVKEGVNPDTGVKWADEAAYFAKANLIKDTKAYVMLDDPEFTRLDNTIQVHECGLIKCWERDELMESSKKAYLTVFSGAPGNDVAKLGGSTGNKSISVFSYSEVDYNPLRMAALYWPELGSEKVMGKAGFTPLNLSKYDNFEKYTPTVNSK